MNDERKSISARVFSAVLLTFIIFGISTVSGRFIKTGVSFLQGSFMTHTIMLILSVLMIYAMKKQVNYRISIPSARSVIMPFLTGLFSSFFINIFLAVITAVSGGKMGSHKMLEQMTPLQVFILVFIYASIAEEFLFRGFLLNMLKPLNKYSIRIFLLRLSLPVIISGILFGFAHVILITTGAGFLFVGRIVVFTAVLGIIAGYYHEKHDNHAYAIIVHMAGNIPAVLGSFLASAGA